MKKLFYVGALSALLLAACGSEETSDKNVNTGATENSADEETPKEEVLSTIGIGDVLRIGDVEFTINSSETATQISDSSGFYKVTPSADGSVFLIVDATVKNVGKEAINTSSSFFSVLTSDDVTYDASSVLIDGFFLFESINPGLSQSGKVAFEIPEGLTDLSIQVQTGFWGTETGIIKLQ